MKKDIVLTPAQSKRLIAKGFYKNNYVKKALDSGKIFLCKGTTNSYIFDEYVDYNVDKKRYTTGVVMPGGEFWINNEKLKDIIIDKGNVIEGDISESVNNASNTDIIVKGANAINYARSTAGILIKHPEGGTIQSVVKALYGKRCKLLIPVGLEKEVSFDLDEMSELMSESDCTPDTPRMFSIRTELFTEIEAIKSLSEYKVSAYHIATGGIFGAQGAVRLLLEGEEDSVLEMIELLKSFSCDDEFSNGEKCE